MNSSKTNKKWKERLHECTHNANFMIGFIIVISVILVAVFAEQIAPYHFTDQKTGGSLEAPSAAHIFGCDELGRDMFSRIVYGSRIALWVAFLGGSLQLVIGVIVGLACGFFGKWVDRVLTFMTDLTWCIPGTIFSSGCCYDYRNRTDQYSYCNFAGGLGKLRPYCSCKDHVSA